MLAIINTPSCCALYAPRGLGYLRSFVAVTCLLWALPLANASDAAGLRLDQVLWRPVQNRQGESLGGLSDVLVQMPSGRIAFVAVDPDELFERPKVMPPSALVIPRGDGALQLDLAKDRWIFAPRLDWDAELVIQNTADGREIYGFYQQAWHEPDEAPSWGMTVVAQPGDTQAPVRYVSLKNLLLERVVTNGKEHVGYIRDFVLDWTGKRATYALISPQITQPGRPEQMWFAVPVFLLSPALKSDALTVNTSLGALRRATPVTAEKGLSADAGASIRRYPVPPS